jgi:hypothetical protein
VHELEEEVKDVEVRAEQSLEEELRRHKEAYGRVQREHSAQIELLSNKYAPHTHTADAHSRRTQQTHTHSRRTGTADAPHTHTADAQQKHTHSRRTGTAV